MREFIIGGSSSPGNWRERLILIASLSLVAVLFAPALPYGASITVDGDFSPGEWNPVLEKRATNQDQPWGPDNDLINLYVSWDTDNLYAGVEGYSSTNNVFFIYIDSSARLTGTEQNDYYPGFSTQSAGWDPDVIYAVCEMDQGTGGSVREIYSDGHTEEITEAVHGSLPGWQNSNGIGGWEISIPWDRLGIETGGTLRVAAGIGWATDKYDPGQPLGGTSGDELGPDSDGDRATLDNPVLVGYDADSDGVPDEISGSSDSVIVRFRLYHPDAGNVNLAGDFNQWCTPSGPCIDTGIDPMNDADGDSIWVLEKKLSQDYHEYKFVVDGCQWLSDPLNTDVNQENNNNSVLIVTDPLVYYIQPLHGSSIMDSAPLVKGSLAASISSEINPDEIRIYLNGQLEAQGASYYDSASSEVNYPVLESLSEGSHEVKISVRNTAGAAAADSSVFAVDIDSIPPAVSHIPPGSVPANSRAFIQAAITDDEEVESASMFYRIRGEAQFSESILAGGFGDQYYTELPASFITEGAVVEYYIIASDGINQARAPYPGIYSFIVTSDDAVPEISEDYPSPPVITPDGDGNDDSSRISFRLSEPSLVELKIFGPGGIPVKTVLSRSFIDADYGSAVWDGSDSLGSQVPDGLYSYHINAEDIAGNHAEEVEGIIEVDRSAPEGTLKIILLFHANQTLNYQSDTANDVCFNGLLNVLRQHPDSRFMLHFSGSLLSSLQWYNFRHSPSTIEILQAGAADGQFEIVGSTYAQNIPYSTDMWDNNVQIEAQRQVIDRALGLYPSSFWNAERCWKQELVPMMAENGYTATWVESHILFDSGTSADEHAVRRTRLGDNEVIIFNDDGELAGNVNYAIDSGDTSPLADYLNYLHSLDIYRDYIVCYCEDAEATGLWDYEAGRNPQDNWDNLDSMLDMLESIEWVELTTFSEYLSSRHPTEMLAPIVDGQANWMVGPSQGAGYNDWFDYNQNSPLLAFYREFFARIRDRVRSIAESARPNSPAGRLAEHAKRNYAAHQFEFGCIGCGDYYCQDYHKMETVEASCLAAEYAQNPVSDPQIVQRDCNGDSIADLLLVTGTDFYVFSPTGGRMLYWFDLERGDQIAGNEIFMNGYYYRGWREYYQGGAYNDDYHYTEDFIWNANPQYPAARPYNRRYRIRKKCFNEMIDSGGGAIDAFLNGDYDFSIDNDTLRFTGEGAGLALEKSFYPESGGLAVRYKVTNNLGHAVELNHKIENFFCPSLLEVIDYGRESLKYLAGEDTTSVLSSSVDGVVNTSTLMRVNYDFADTPSGLSGGKAVFAMELSPEYHHSIASGESAEYRFNLNAEVVTDSGEFPPSPPFDFRLYQNVPNPFNPRTRITFSLKKRGRVRIRIFNVRGRLVRNLLDEVRSPGVHSVFWSGLGGKGQAVASGVYLCRLESGGRAETRKLVLLR